MADMKSRLQLDGEQEYKKALEDAYRSLRVLRSELKAETAELGKNASAQDKASKKSASLKKQIEQKQKIVARIITLFINISFSMCYIQSLENNVILPKRLPK